MTRGHVRGLANTAALAAFSAALLAQGPPPPPPPPPPPAPAATSSVPLTPLAVGTGSIRGRAIAAGSSPRGLPRAIVKLSAGGSTRSRSVITDAEGTFAFDGLPAGRFTLTASKPAYITSAYGSTRPGRPGTPLTLAGGQVMSDIAVPLAKGAVLAGRVVDEHGAPVPDLLVGVLRARQDVSSPSGDPFRSDYSTDDQGAFRIYGLEPGTYVVAVGIRAATNLPVVSLPKGEIDVALAELQRRNGRAGGSAGTAAQTAGPVQSLQYVGEYYPGTPDLADATPITLSAGEERTDIDIRFTHVPSASVQGVVSAPGGVPSSVAMSLAPVTPSRLPAFLLASPQLTVRPLADGHFTFTGVAPGHYVLTARTQPNVQPSRIDTGAGGGASGASIAGGQVASPSEALFATADVVVIGEDIKNLSLELRPSPHVSGRIVFDATTLIPPADLSSVRIVLVPSHAADAVGALGNSTTGTFAFNTREATVTNASREGVFDMAGVVPDTYRLTVTLPGREPWWLRSAIAGGRDVLDTGAIVEGDSLRDAVITFTDRHTELGGVLQSTAGTPAPEYFVVAFARDRALWKPLGRRLFMTRPSTDGRFSMKDVPPGDYYLAALTDLDPDDWQTPEFLSQLVPASLQITIGEGEKKTQDIRIK